MSADRTDGIEIISKTTRQIGGVTVNFTVGRIKPRIPANRDDDAVQAGVRSVMAAE
jgi:hypothetical protein